MQLTSQDKQLIRLLQEDLPLSSTPFADLGARLGLSEDEVLARIKEFKEGGLIRRFGAALRHREIGFTANAMVVWQVPEDRIEAVGKEMASFEEVSHCYQRPSFPGWPYNLFAMVHGQSCEECAATAARIAQRVGVDYYRLLFSTRELKKTSMRYFLD